MLTCGKDFYGKLVMNNDKSEFVEEKVYGYNI